MHVHHRTPCANCTLCYCGLHYASSRQLSRQQTSGRPRPIFVRDTTHMIAINKDDSWYVQSCTFCKFNEEVALLY